MTQHHTGPRPQRHEIVEALDAFIDGIVGVLPAAAPFRAELHTKALELLERLKVDTASVRVTAGHAPHLTVGAPPHDVEDPGASPSTLRP